MGNPKTKELLLKEFAEMRALEKSAQDFYAKIVVDPMIESVDVRATFNAISGDERRHVQLVDRIFQIIKNNL